MSKSSKNRTEYQEFLYSLFQKYEIEPDESWSNVTWKVIVDSRSTNKQNLANFYKELSDYNIKNPSDENWTHKIDEKLEKDGQEVKVEIVKEEKVETIEVKSKDKKEKEFKECPYCAEDIKFAAIKCKYCGELIGEEIDESVNYGDHRDWSKQKIIKKQTRGVQNTHETNFFVKVVIGTILVILTSWLVYYVAINIIFRAYS